MKNLLVVSLMFLAGGTWAGAPAAQSPKIPLTNGGAFKQIVPYQMVCSSYTIGTSTSEITGNTIVSNTTAGVSWVRVRNLSASATVYCNGLPTVTASGAAAGDPIAPYSSGEPNAVEYLISTMQPWYCIASAAGTPAIICTRQ